MIRITVPDLFANERLRRLVGLDQATLQRLIRAELADMAGGLTTDLRDVTESVITSHSGDLVASEKVVPLEGQLVGLDFTAGVDYAKYQERGTWSYGPYGVDPPKKGAPGGIRPRRFLRRTAEASVPKVLARLRRAIKGYLDGTSGAFR